MDSKILAKCDDCGVETDRDDLYDLPFDKKVRCPDCFLVFSGYDIESVNRWAASLACDIRRRLAENSKAITGS
jgi:hypothetical protein